MTSDAKTVDEYIAHLPEDRKLAIQKMRAAIKSSLPDGFEEMMNYGMMGVGSSTFYISSRISLQTE